MSMSDNNLASLSPTDRLLTFEQALERSPVEDLRASMLASKQAFKRIAFNLVIIGYLSLATIVGVAELPVVPDAYKGNLISLGAPIGMRQGWRVFSPDLRTTNWHTVCLIELEDGTIKAVEFPRMEKLSLIERFIHEKQRNILGDRITNPIYKRFRPMIARYYARANINQCTVNAHGQPVRVTFVFASAPMPDIHGSHWVYRDQLPEHTFRQVYFSYAVKPEDLEK
ncbi:MAG: hypothetical protein WCT03_23280 [Candidatus Obscuribacterales bacterium]